VDSSYPIGDGGSEADAGEEVACGLVIAGGDTAPILQSIEGTLDDIAALVSDRIVHVRSAIGLVTNQPARRRYQSKESTGVNDIVHVATGQQQSVEPTDGIAERADFGGPACIGP